MEERSENHLAIVLLVSARRPLAQLLKSSRSHVLNLPPALHLTMFPMCYLTFLCGCCFPSHLRIRVYFDSGKALQRLADVKAVRGLGDVTGLQLTQQLSGERVLL